MNIGICNDHRGFLLKQKLIKELQNKGYNIIDCGTDSNSSVDYPDYAFKLGELLTKKEADFGIAICGTGIGISIACNKVKGIRCAKVDNCSDAKLSRLHNDANIMAINGKMTFIRAKKIVDIFLKTKFSNENRHITRLNKIKSYEEKIKNEQ